MSNFPERNEISYNDPDFWRKYFAAFRRDVRDAISSYAPNNPCVSDDFIIETVREVVEKLLQAEKGTTK